MVPLNRFPERSLSENERMRITTIESEINLLITRGSSEKINIANENSSIQCIQLLQPSEVAELRWDGASELIGREGPEKAARIRTLKGIRVKNEID